MPCEKTGALIKSQCMDLSRLSSVVEQLFCKQQVVSPNLTDGSDWSIVFGRLPLVNMTKD